LFNAQKTGTKKKYATGALPEVPPKKRREENFAA
jgi:hypothetical protein